MENIKEVRKTAKGNVIITTKQGEATNLRKAVQSITNITNVRALQGKKVTTLHVRGMDAITTLEEVRVAIETASSTKEVEVKALRPMRNGNQAATVKVEEYKANRLINLGKIRIGLSICLIEERINATRCFRCWNFGHLAGDCSGPDRRSSCYRCGKDGHNRKECKNEPKCVLCAQSGHETGGDGCPEGRAALDKERRPRSI